ncbi:hypothetical protein Sme01_24840 [Sphaerisporangium melleum]|uniref:Uncharacterized protein n=1 Tax=Sphaerisporangium melleum TaxID=321316 RepID=A0A917QRL6_9ACTN|nr:hypothetical protein GCM10007964_05090 [Sphaerisporangium melleum]GII70008.1 hypothetical protein Sme01_24840 [Sphaerisporangium melleum]
MKTAGCLQAVREQLRTGLTEGPYPVRVHIATTEELLTSVSPHFGHLPSIYGRYNPARNPLDALPAPPGPIRCVAREYREWARDPAGTI